MKHTITTIIALLTILSAAFGQNKADSIVSRIIENNTQLSALKKSSDAKKIGNKTGIYLKNPEAEFAYLFGNPDDMGNRINFSVKQSLDFPTAYRHKNRISNLKNVRSDLMYDAEKSRIKTEAELICSELIYTKALIAEYDEHSEHAQDIARIFEQKLKSGETNIISHNKAQIHLLNIKRRLKLLKSKQQSLLRELARLNGGKEVTLADSSFKIMPIPDDFDKWFSETKGNIPSLSLSKKETEIQNQQIKLNRALSLPKFTVGYMSEALTSQQFRGISLGVSVPLWENKNRIKYAAAKADASRENAADKELQYYNYLKKLYETALILQETIEDYRVGLQSFDHNKLLRTALDEGEISLLDYIREKSFYYQSKDKLLETQNELNKTLIKLKQYETGI